MLSLLNPSVLLAALLGSLVCFGSGFFVGKDYADKSCTAQAADAAFAAIDGFNQRLEVAQQLAAEEARSEALASFKSKTARARGVANAKTKVNPVCRLSESDLSVFNAAIGAANGTADTNPVLDGMPAAEQSGER